MFVHAEVCGQGQKRMAVATACEYIGLRVRVHNRPKKCNLHNIGRSCIGHAPSAFEDNADRLFLC